MQMAFKHMKQKHNFTQRGYIDILSLDYHMAKSPKTFTTHFLRQTISKEVLFCNAGGRTKWHNI